MGKDGKRPKAAASSKVADIIANSPSTGGFGFSTARFPNPSQSWAPLNEDNLELDPAIRVIFKKIGKRDSVTKFKAVDELHAYLKNDPSLIPTIIPSWVIEN